jgi:pimeloyl-ACP methyl ester carboxylesterase
MVKISYPEKQIKKDKIIVWSMSSLKDDFLPDSITESRYLWIGPILRKALLNSGYVNIEYIGRNDSVTYNNRKYKASDTNTKANDLENLLNYVRTIKRLKNSKIILNGHSEGGEINVITASRNPSGIYAILQLASCALAGKEIANYQREQLGYLAFLMETGGGDQAYMDSTANKFTSLDSYHKADIDGVKQFFKENIEPIDAFIYQFDNMDSIYYHIDLFLRSRWEKEDIETKDLYKNDFERYYKIFAGNITPHQITLRKFNPEKYSFIKCPVLAVHGTADKRIDCYPNMESMEQLLKKGGNLNFEKIIMEGYSHSLIKRGDPYEGMFHAQIIDPSLEDSVIERIIEWIDRQ